MKRVIFFTYLMFLIACHAAPAEAKVCEDAVRRIWSEVCAVAGVEPLPLFIEENDELNAYQNTGNEKMPDDHVKRESHVSINTGLMKILETDDEVFGVLAHELGHHVHQHGDKGDARTEEIRISANMMAHFIGGGYAAYGLAVTAGKVNLMEYSRTCELEADAFAVDLALKAGRDPMAGIYSVFEQMIAAEGSVQFSIKSTHPSSGYRLEAIRRRICTYREEGLDPVSAVERFVDAGDIGDLEEAVAEQLCLLEQGRIKLEESKKMLDDLRKGDHSATI